VESRKGQVCNARRAGYDLAEEDSRRVFDQLVGGSFDAAEPTTVFLTQQSVFVLLNFKYTAFNVGDRGQALVALEFSRSLKRYKTLYCVYSTTQFSGSTREVFTATGPYVARALASIFTGQSTIIHGDGAAGRRTRQLWCDFVSKSCGRLFGPVPLSAAPFVAARFADKDVRFGKTRSFHH
jgi:hypothetical protein